MTTIAETLAHKLRTEPLPFSLSRMTADGVQQVDRELTAWCTRYGYGDATFRKVARAYVEYCAPANPSETGVQLVTDYVAWFFLLNDSPAGVSQASTIRDAIEAIRSGGATGTPETRAAADLRAAAIGAWGEPTTRRLRGFIERMLQAFEWESGLRGKVPTSQSYLEHREHTIANYAFIELWRLSQTATPSESASPELCTLEGLNTKLVYLVNDLLSVERDKRTHKLNLVNLLAREQAITTHEAFELAHAELLHTVESFAHAWRQIIEDPQLEDSTKAYANYLASLNEGNRAATAALEDRFWGDG